MKCRNFFIASILYFRLLIKKVKDYQDLINYLISISADSGELETIKKKIKNQREISVQSQGEYSFDNLVFKELRNKGYMNFKM